MKVLFAGSPAAARITLQYLYEKQSEYDFSIVGVLSNPPTAKGRHKTLTPTPVAEFAEEKNIPVITPEHLDESARNAIQPLGADFLISFAYGHIFGPKFLEMFSLGGINLHPSLLPKYRGCTPVTAAILNRDKQTAVTVQTLSLKMDEGNILAQTLVPLCGTETGESLLNYCASEGAKLICEVIKETWKEKKLPLGKVQQGEPSYTKIITKEDCKINWTESAQVIEAKIRAFYPEPASWCVYDGQPLKILAAKAISTDTMSCSSDTTTPSDLSNSSSSPIAANNAVAGTVLNYEKTTGINIKTGDGVLCVQQLQKQGKNKMDYKDFINGARDFIGTVLQ